MTTDQATFRALTVTCDDLPVLTTWYRTGMTKTKAMHILFKKNSEIIIFV